MQFLQTFRPCRALSHNRKHGAPEEQGSGLDKAFDDMVEKGCFAGIANLMCGKTPDEMSIEAQAALNKISQPQVPEQAER